LNFAKPTTLGYPLRMYKEKTNDIEVEVSPEYLVKESSPEAARYVFAYHVTITNKSDYDVQLMARHWIITDGQGEVHDVKGDGVIGEQPKLKPGQSHKYTSFCPLTTPTGNMRGTFQMRSHKGATFDVKIPLFFLRDSRLLH
jgi:ApaG protein